MSFAWGVYNEVPGLRMACCAFLAEPRVLQVEAELRRYWMGLSPSGVEGAGTLDGWAALCVWARDELAEPLPPVATGQAGCRPARRRPVRPA
jgi:hypothetical protein